MKRIQNSILILAISFCFSFWAQAQNPQEQVMLDKINKLRSKGCNCGGVFMSPAAPLKWNAVLLTSAYRHAEDMNKKNYFSHFSPTGTDVGDRIDAVGYVWSFCGENLGSGQTNFDQVMEDWIKSPTHCRMLLSQEVDDVAVAKVGTYWVQHFGKKFDQE
jgi:uncharacterized protein YkwD